MIKRKHESEPFENVSTDKRAYDMSTVEPDKIRKEIKNYIENLYPFMSAGLQYVNFNKSPDADGNAIGSIDYEGQGIKLTIPIIMEEHNLKEPTIGIYNKHAIPIDKEYIEYIIDYPEYGEQVSEDELPANMQYILQSGLFNNESPNVSKQAEVAIGTIFEEDPDNPYHYHGTILKLSADNSVRVDEGGYYNAAEMLKLTKQAVEAKDILVDKNVMVVGKDERIGSAPKVSKITDSGMYRNIFLGGEVSPAYVICNTFNIEPNGVSKSLVFKIDNSDDDESSIIDRIREIRYPKWGYGDAFGSGYMDAIDPYIINSDYLRQIKDPQGKDIVILRGNKTYRGLISIGTSYSAPYHVDQQETLTYGDAGDKALVLYVTNMDKIPLCFIISDKTAEISEIDPDKLKHSSIGHLYDDKISKYIIVPAEYMIRVIRGVRNELTNVYDGYRGIVEKVSEDYPNTMEIINKGKNLYTINVSDGDTVIKHADVSSNGALLLANYYTGNDKSNISGYAYEQPYQFNGDISKRACDRRGLELLNEYRGEFKKLAEHISSYKHYKGIDKIADISGTVDKLVGIDTSLDDEWISTNDVLHLLDTVIGKIAELLLMARLGKNDISESILGRAMYAMVKLSNEIRGASSSGTY